MTTLKGGVTSYGARYSGKPREQWNTLNELANAIMFDNNIANTYQNLIPANIRFAVGNLLFPTTITERNFSKRELENIKQIINNVDKRNKSTVEQYNHAKSNVSKASNDDDMIYNPMINRYQQAGMVGDMLNIPKFKGATYADMTTDYGTYNPYIYEKRKLSDMVRESFANPVVDIQTSIGQFYSEKDNKGNRIINDAYDFKKILNQKWAGDTYKGIHKIMEDYGTPKQMYIKLND